MLMNLNGRERTATAFAAMCASVEPKLKLQRVIRPEQGELSLIEITLDSVNWEAKSNGTHATNGVNGINGH